MFFSGPCTRPWVAILLCFHLLPFSLFTQATSIGKRDALADSGLSSASWIWTAEHTKGNTAFLRTFSSTLKKSATSATIWMTAVNQFTLWVNGQPIFQSGAKADNWMSVQQFSVALNASTNTFSVLAVNHANKGAPAPGLLAAIHIAYSDGSGEVLLSDASWAVASTAIPADFPTPASTTEFVLATVVRPFGSGNTNLTIPAADPNPPSTILSGSTWIWNTPTANTGAPVGRVAFRKTLVDPAGKHAQTATVLMTADNGFTLYLNGQYVGAPPPTPVLPDYTRPQQFTLDVSSSSPNTLTVVAANIPSPGATDAGPAGLAASIIVQYSDGSTTVLGTDTTWLTGTNAFTDLSAFTQQPDSALKAAVALGTMGVQPWGTMAGIANALAASAVPSLPVAPGTLLPSGSPSPSAGPTSSHSTSVGLIVGVTVGGLALVAAIGLVLLLFWRRRRARDDAVRGKPFDLDLAGDLQSQPPQPESQHQHWPPPPELETHMGSVQASLVSTSYASPHPDVSERPPFSENGYLRMVPVPRDEDAQPPPPREGKLARERRNLATANAGSVSAGSRSEDVDNEVEPPNYYAE